MSDAPAGHRPRLLRGVRGLRDQGAARRRPAPDSGRTELAEAACEIEIDVLGRKVGKQDQYAAAFGGVRAYTFHPDGRWRPASSSCRTR